MKIFMAITEGLDDLEKNNIHEHKNVFDSLKTKINEHSCCKARKLIKTPSLRSHEVAVAI
ncbi:MAG: hypothetical protein LN573_04025 [Rickettsia endosymbiont of Oxypoda opaca]|nr:hypothetical protein [Rickettsia endosymbiont of Oxypoda opaca]